MTDDLIRIILTFSSGSVLLLWVITVTTSSYNLKEWIKRLTVLKLNTLVVIVLETIISLQLLKFIEFEIPNVTNKIVLSVSGLIIHISGALIAAWAKVTMKASWGAPAQHDIKKQKNLVTSGPFKYTRNPIYLGLLMMFLGLEFALRSYLMLLTVPIYYLMLKAIKIEEKLLEKHFDKSYLDYKKKVSRFLPIFIKN